MVTKSPKVLVIGLDGATFDLLQPLVDMGYLPNLGKLMDQGYWGRLDSTIPPFTAAAWSTLATGQNPGQHGVLSFRKRDSFNYDTLGSGFVDARQLGTTIWEVMSDEGKKVGVVNVPLTYPARPVNGFMVTGMLTPPQAAEYTYPPEFAQKLGEDYIVDVDFIRGQSGFRQSGFPSKAEMLPSIRQMSHTRAKYCIRLLKEEPWDFFVVVFTSTDRVSHFFWDDLEDLLAENPPRNEAGETIKQELLAYFRELDDDIGQLIETAGPSAHIVMMSDHGFGPSPTRRAYPNIWLEQNGFLQKRGREGISDLEYWRVLLSRQKHLKTLVRRLLPQSTQHKVTTASRASSSDIIDWSKTQAYWVPIYFHVSGIEINLKGKRREGVVSAGEEYEALRDRIIQASAQFIDPATGKCLIKKAARREDIYSGPYVESFPDVILIFDPDYIGAESLAGSLFAEEHKPFRPGEHRQDGIFISAGPSVKSGGELNGLRLLDVPATILYMMGLSIPSFFDGRVLTEIFDPDFLAAHPVRIHDADRDQLLPDTSDSAYSDEEEMQLGDRLRGLGYLE
ncbi:MAG: alkaline phosphatase family protein [Candidatus Promineifilaceae bacterium]|jgi:predicted AlkP superfamily phosphohydrolase/phosphomutase